MARFNLLVAIAVMGIALASAQTFPPHTGFPYCRCHDYSSASLPAKLYITSEDAGELEITVNTVEPVGEPTPCYTQLQENGIEKIEIKSTKLCDKTTLTVYINGVKSAGWRFDAKNKVISIPFKSIPFSSTDGTIIKIVGTAGCASKAAILGGKLSYSLFNWANKRNLCCPGGNGGYAPPPPPPGVPPPNSPDYPPPTSPEPPTSPDLPPPLSPKVEPPPPLAPPPLSPEAPFPPFDAPSTPNPPPGFPFCKCRRDSYNTPFAFELDSQTEVAKGLEIKGHFVVNGCSEDPEDPNVNPCCDEMDLSKIEFHINDQCYGNKNVYDTITVSDPSGNVLSVHRPSWQDYGAGRKVFKITKLGPLNYDDADGVIVSFIINKSSACAVENGFFAAGGQIALVDSKTKCCPTYSLFPAK